MTATVPRERVLLRRHAAVRVSAAFCECHSKFTAEFAYSSLLARSRTVAVSLALRPPRCKVNCGDMVRPPGLSLIHHVSRRIIDWFRVDAAVCRELMGGD